MSRTRNLSYVLWSAVATTGAACGDDPVGMLPDATDGPRASFASQLEASSACGVAMPPTVDLVITNNGNADLVISEAEADGGFTVTTALPITIRARAEGTLAVRPPAAVIGTDLGGSTKTGMLALTTNEAGARTRQVELKANVLGAQIGFTDAGGAAIKLALNSNTAACPAPQAVFVRNTGTAPVTVAMGASSGLFTSGFSSVLLDPDEAIEQQVGLFSVSGACSGNGTITYQLTGDELCSDTTVTLQATFNITGTSTCFCS